MGLIKMAASGISDVIGGGLNALGGASASSVWREYFTSGDMSNSVLMKRAEKVVVKGSKNTKADDNLISNGSGIDIQEGQCMIFVSNGRIVEFCAEPGRYTYSEETAPSLIPGPNQKFGQALKNYGKEILAQWSAGGQRFSTQRVYFINMGHIYQPILWGLGNCAFKHRQVVLEGAAPIMRNVTLRAHGTVEVQIGDPIAFYNSIGAQKAGGDNDGLITVNNIENTIFKSAKTAIASAINAAISQLGQEQVIAWTEIGAHGPEIEALATEKMANTSLGKCGFEFHDFHIDGNPELREEDYDALAKMEQEWSEKAFMASNVNMANYDIQKTFAKGFENAGKNGGAQGIVGLGMGMGMGGFGNFGNLQGAPSQAPQGAGAMGAMSVAPAPSADLWECSNCHKQVEGNFCPNCGAKKETGELPSNEWVCPDCGKKNTTNFCANCGTKKPVVKKLKCDKCGWEPKPGTETPRFCPNCGDIINDADYI